MSRAHLLTEELKLPALWLGCLDPDSTYRLYLPQTSHARKQCKELETTGISSGSWWPEGSHAQTQGSSSAAVGTLPILSLVSPAGAFSSVS